MTALPIRHWLLLALVALITLPTLATTLVAALERRHLEPPSLPDATVQQEVTANVARWDDPAWQAAIEPRLNAAGTDVVLFDGAGRELFRTAPDPLEAATVPGVVARPDGDVVAATAPSRLASKVVVSDGAQPLGTAYLYQSPLPFTADFGRQWLLPLTQVVTFLIVAGAAAWFVNGALLRPLAAMGRAAHDIAAGNLDFRLPPSRVWEVAEVATAFGAMGAALRTSLERQA